MTANATLFDSLKNALEHAVNTVVASKFYQYLLTQSVIKRIAMLTGLGLLALSFLMGSLYLVFGKIVVIGFVASILAGLATGVGALPALFFKKISNNVFNSILGAAAGVMLAATAFSLLVPGIEYANQLWPGKGIYLISAGMLIGAWFLHAADKHLPHVHFDSIDNDQLNTLNKVGLFIMAITLHNFPEGLSVGVSFGADQMKNGFVLAIAVALQNIPEGLAVALPLVGIGVNKWRAVGIATLTGLVEPIGGLLGVTMVTVIEPIMPIAMGFAVGAMLFVISEEIIPETHSKGRSRYATFALMICFIIMMILDNMLG